MKCMRENYNPDIYAEYLKLGDDLKNLTNAIIAGKFEISPSSINPLAELDDDDIRLIRELVQERKRMLRRRKVLSCRLR